MRANTFDGRTGEITIGAERADAYQANAAHFAGVFRDGVDAYAIPRGALTDPRKLEDLAAFFWWTSWASVTERPGEKVTYTQNWPHEPLVGNHPTGSSLVWSVLSFVLLLAGIGALAWYQGGREEQHHVASALPERDPLFGLHPTPSQRATLKYFWVVAALLVVQIALGAVTAHYGVEGSGFYGFPLAEWLPYAVARTWHTQLGIFWIATAWLATGLYMGPEIGTWWARSADFMQQPLMNTIRWLRVPGDTVFAFGAIVLGWFVLGLRTGWSLEKHGAVAPGSTQVLEPPTRPAAGRA